MNGINKIDLVKFINSLIIIIIYIFFSILFPNKEIRENKDKTNNNSYNKKIMIIIKIM